MNLTNDDVRDIVELLDSLPYDELRLRTSRFALTLRRAPDGGWTQTTAGSAALDPLEVDTPPPADSNARPGTPSGAVDGDRRGLREVRAPLVGTFYRAPSPGAPPYVDVGSNVDDDTVVGIVETMKLMNPVYAGVRGTVAEICMADAELAEQDAVLMRITPETRA